MVIVVCALFVVLGTAGSTSATDVARGRVYHDKNGNGEMDDGESGLKAV